MSTLIRLSVALALALVVIVGCTTETMHVSEPSVRMEPPKTTLLGRATVLSDGKAVGTIRNLRFEDGTGRRILRVFDGRDENLGYVTDDGLAYRYSAHDGSHLVANNNDLRKNLAAIFGRPLESFQVRVDAGEL